MINMSVKIKIPDFIKKIQLEKPIKQTIFEIWNDIRTDAVINAPYKSWSLRRSLSVIVQDKWFTVEVWSNLVYARIQEEWWTINWNPYLHFKIWNNWIKKRSVRIRWKRFLKNSYDKHKQNIEEKFRQNFENYIMRLSRRN